MMGWWNNILRQRASQWTYGALAPGQVPDRLEHRPVQADMEYVSIFLRSMRVVDVRRGLKKFYGTVHSFITLPYDGDDAKFHVLTTPSDLKNIDPTNLDRVITLNFPLLGPVPYRGGGIQMELGLFSIMSVDLADACLSILQRMASDAGVTFVSKALPFVGPIMDGIGLLTGSSSDTILEIGVNNNFDKLETGYFVAIRAPAGTIDLSGIKLNENRWLVDKNGQLIGEFPYMVFSIEASSHRENWRSIPEIAKAHADLISMVRQRSFNATNEAFTVFKTIAMTCPDLLRNDAANLVAQVDDDIKLALPGLQTKAFSGKIPRIRSLSEIELYQ